MGLHREPFSTSPDPAFFYLSKEHRAALYRLRIAVKLRRGLSLVLGDVGTGKTTLSRRFIQLAGHEPATAVFMILNPLFSNELDFLKELCRRFGITVGPDSDKTSVYFNEIENFLFRKGVDQAHTIVLLIDEAQKLSDRCLEVLRGLLNYETNEYKLLQVILVSQMEIVPRLAAMRNFWDRISLKQLLKPFGYEEMRQMIAYRLKAAGYQSPIQLFTEEALRAVHRASRGFPRQVTQLCHDCLEYLVMYNQGYVDRALVEDLVTRDSELLILKDVIGAPPTDVGATVSAERSDARRAFI